MAAEEGVAGFLNAIPSAAASPLALVAYVVAVAAWVAVGYNTGRLSILMKDILHLPEPDRIKAIRAAIGHVEIPTGITGEEYLRKRIHTFVFWVSFPPNRTAPTLAASDGSLCAV